MSIIGPMSEKPLPHFRNPPHPAAILKPRDVIVIRVRSPNRFVLIVGLHQTALIYQMVALGPSFMRPIARFVSLELWDQDVLWAGNAYSEQTVTLHRGSLFPIHSELPQNVIGHEIHMPAVTPFKLTADHRLIT